MMAARSSAAITAAVVGMLTAAVTTTSALTVTAPSEGMTVVADRPYPVAWTGASAGARFEIDLHYCGSYSFCMELDDCGFYIASLCPEGEAGCAQAEEGEGYPVTMPEPLAHHSGDGYRVRIVEVGTEEYRCSDDFYLMDSGDAPVAGEAGGGYIEVLSPTSHSVAMAGETYTVEFDYDNGFGDSVGRFKLDLYQSQGEGDCGTWVTSVCAKPDTGCLDTQGDYDVTIPALTAAGMYKVRVGLFGDDSLYACSEAFEVVSAGGALWLDEPLV